MDYLHYLYPPLRYALNAALAIAVFSALRRGPLQHGFAARNSGQIDRLVKVARGRLEGGVPERQLEVRKQFRVVLRFVGMLTVGLAVPLVALWIDRQREGSMSYVRWVVEENVWRLWGMLIHVSQIMESLVSLGRYLNRFNRGADDE